MDSSAAELRRIERDLHDGAQARLVAMGMSLGTIEALIEKDPAQAKQLIAQARESSAEALTELRDLVRGIHPPVLAERGLGDAVKALALRMQVPVEADVELPGRFAEPVESAAYFAISEVLTNAAKHSGAERVWLDIHYSEAAGRHAAHRGHGQRAGRCRPEEGLGDGRRRTPSGTVRRRPRRQQPRGRPHDGDDGDPLRDRGTTVNHGAEVRLQVRPPLGDDELNALFAASWPDHRRTAFGPRLARSLLWVAAFRGDGLVGYVNVVGDGGVHAFVLDTTVHPSVRRRGVGVSLVRRAADEARGSGARWLHVDHEEHLTDFYARCGFRPTAAGVRRLG